MTNSAATIALPTVAAARAQTDPTMCVGGEWNDLVLMRRIGDALDMGAIEAPLADFIVESISAMPLGAERDGKVAFTIKNVIALIMAHEDIAAGRA